MSATPTTTYLAVAYRWGWTNYHQYFVLSSTSLDLVREAAHDECDDRGGKYGVAVYQMPERRGQPPVLLEYMGSTYGEKAPHENPRLNTFRRLGQQAFFAVKDGHASLPRADGTPVLDYVPVEVPQWIRAEAARIEDDEQGMAELREKYGPKMQVAKPGLPAEVPAGGLA